MIENLKKNVDTEIEILREISNYLRRLDYAGPNEQRMIYSAISSLEESMKIINRSIPDILNNISLAKKLPSKSNETNLERINYNRIDSRVNVTLKSKDRDRFLKELSIGENMIRSIHKKENFEIDKGGEFKAARGYLKVSNKFFLNFASRLIEKGYFRSLSGQIKKANLDILFEAYISMMFFTTFLSFFAGLILSIVFLFFNFSLSFPFFELYTGGYLTRSISVLLIPIFLPIIVFISFYFYPNTERGSIAKRIDQELPFAVIHMSSISGSGIEPTQIFKIIGLSKEYPYIKKEIRKVLNQINLYGYDLVTALSNVSKNSPSEKLAELFSGVGASISTGGDLSTFFTKRAETLLMDYRLEREKYTRVAETFMDIYISIVIAAPMILMLLLILISLTVSDTGLNPKQLALLIIFGVGIINLLFIIFLQAKQPTY